jgi:hypothetical protein
MAICGVGLDKDFQPFDPGSRRCRNNHLRLSKPSDVKVIELDRVMNVSWSERP